jgi:hypothetical protein
MLSVIKPLPFALQAATAALALISVGCSGDSASTMVSLDASGARARIDLGTALLDDVLRREISLTNPDHHAVDLVRFRSSCECASISPGEITVPAGGQGAVELMVDLAREGNFTGQLGIEIDGYDSQENVVFRLLALLDVRPAETGAQHAAAP